MKPNRLFLIGLNSGLSASIFKHLQDQLLQQMSQWFNQNPSNGYTTKIHSLSKLYLWTIFYTENKKKTSFIYRKTIHSSNDPEILVFSILVAIFTKKISVEKFYQSLAQRSYPFRLVLRKTTLNKTSAIPFFAYFFLPTYCYIR